MPRTDDFDGSTDHLLTCIDSFLDLTDEKAFVPHNLDKGSHAYRLLVAARVRLEASIQSEAKALAGLVTERALSTPAQAEPVAWPVALDPAVSMAADFKRVEALAPPQDRGERAAIVAWLRSDAAKWHHPLTDEAILSLAEQIEQGLHHRAQALADLAEGDAELIGGGDG